MFTETKVRIGRIDPRTMVRELELAGSVVQHGSAFPCAISAASCKYLSWYCAGNSTALFFSHEWIFTGGRRGSRERQAVGILERFEIAMELTVDPS